MMSIFILVGAYRYYASLAERLGKTKWHFGLLGIGIYLGFQIAFLFSYGIYTALTNPEGVLNNDSYTGFSVINLISWLFAIGGVYGIYHLLEKKFKNERKKDPIWEIEQLGTEQEKSIHN